jgi:hypothetical protein
MISQMISRIIHDIIAKLYDIIDDIIHCRNDIIWSSDIIRDIIQDTIHGIIYDIIYDIMNNL